MSFSLLSLVRVAQGKRRQGLMYPFGNNLLTGQIHSMNVHHSCF